MTMRKKSRRMLHLWLAMLLAMAMTAVFMPAAVFAEEGDNGADTDLSNYQLKFSDSKDGWRLYTTTKNNITINAEVCQGETTVPKDAYDLVIKKESFDENNEQTFSDPITNGSVDLDDADHSTFIVYAKAKEDSNYTGTAGLFKNDKDEYQYTYINIFYEKSLAGADVTFTDSAKNAEKADISTPMFDLFTAEYGETLTPVVSVNGKTLTTGNDYSVTYKEGILKAGGEYKNDDGEVITNYFVVDKDGAEESTGFPTTPGIYRCIVTGAGEYKNSSFDRAGVEVQSRKFEFEDFSCAITGGSLTADGSDLAGKVVLSAVEGRTYTEEIKRLLADGKIIPVFLPASEGQSDKEKSKTLTTAGEYWMWAGWSDKATENDKTTYTLPMSPLAATVPNPDNPDGDPIKVGGGNIVVAASSGGDSGSFGSGAAADPTPEQTIVTGTDSPVEVSATVSDGTAAIAPISTEALSKVEKDETITLDVTAANTGGSGAAGQEVSSVTIPTETVKNIADSSAKAVEIKLDTATATLDDKTLDALAAKAEGSDVKFTVEKDQKAETTMNGLQTEAVKELRKPVVIEASFVSGGNKISDFSGGTVVLQIAFSTNLSVRAWYLPDTGIKEATSCSYNGVIATLTLRHFSHYALEEYEMIANTMKVKALTQKAKPVTVKTSKLKKASQTIAAKKYVTVKKAAGKVSYKKVSGNAAFKVNTKNGKITVKKGTKKGTYKVKIKVAAAGNDDYLPVKKTVTCWIKVK